MPDFVCATVYYGGCYIAEKTQWQTREQVENTTNEYFPKPKHIAVSSSAAPCIPTCKRHSHECRHTGPERRQVPLFPVAHRHSPRLLHKQPQHLPCVPLKPQPALARSPPQILDADWIQVCPLLAMKPVLVPQLGHIIPDPIPTEVVLSSARKLLMDSGTCMVEAWRWCWTGPEWRGASTRSPGPPLTVRWVVVKDEETEEEESVLLLIVGTWFELLMAQCCVVFIALSSLESAKDNISNNGWVE